MPRFPRPDTTSASTAEPGQQSFGGDEQKVSNTEFMREFPETLALDLATALNDWSRLAAARERSIITLGTISEKNVEAARQRYESLRRQAKVWTNGKMVGLGLDLPESALISKQEDMTEAKLAGLSIRSDAQRLAELNGPLAGKRQKFYDWWARQGGGDKFFSRQRLKGTAKKAAVMTAIGLPIGVIAGTAGVFLVGPFAGAAATAGVSRGVARGLMRGRIEKNSAAKTVAAAQFETHLAAQQATVEAAHERKQGKHLRNHELDTVTNVYAEATINAVRRNRLRTIGSVATSTVFGIGGSFLGEVAHNAFWNHSHAIPSVKQGTGLPRKGTGYHPATTVAPTHPSVKPPTTTAEPTHPSVKPPAHVPVHKHVRHHHARPQSTGSALIPPPVRPRLLPPRHHSATPRHD